MARPLRIGTPDGLYHVTSRALGRLLACALLDHHSHPLGPRNQKPRGPLEAE